METAFRSRSDVGHDDARRDRVQSVDRALDVLEARRGRRRARRLGGRRAHRARGEHRAPPAGEPGRSRLRAPELDARPLPARPEAARAGERACRRSTAALCAAARPHLERIQSVTRETTNLVILVGDRVVYVDQVAGRHSMRMFTELGSSALAHTTGSGKAMLAYQPAEDDRGHLPARARAVRAADPAHAHDARVAERGVRAHPPPRVRARRRGARGGRELRRGAGVRRHAATAFAAISISAPTSRIVHADISELGRLLRRQAAEVSAALGYEAAPDRETG